MKELKKELKKAKERMIESWNVYCKKSTQINYNEYLMKAVYYEGLNRAFDLIEKEINK